MSLLMCIEGSCICFMLRKSHCLFTAGCLASICYHVNLVHLVKLVVKLMQKLYVDISRRAKKLALLLVCTVTRSCGCWLLHPLFLLAVLSQFAVLSSHRNAYKTGMLCFNMFRHSRMAESCSALLLWLSVAMQ